MERLCLHKCSNPGWSKRFDSEVELVEELRNWVCDSCLTGSVVIDYNNLDDLLWTPCGSEFIADNEII